MKRLVCAIVGLACMTAVPLCAQAQAGPPPAVGGSSCTLVTKSGDQNVETPLPGFDPGKNTPLPPSAGGIAVVCTRATIIPEVSDYRVLSEMHLPLMINARSKTILLRLSGGGVELGMPEGQEATPDETKALKDRLDQMAAAMRAKGPPAAANGPVQSGGR
jgi:hypothetical protein